MAAEDLDALADADQSVARPLFVDGPPFRRPGPRAAGRVAEPDVDLARLARACLRAFVSPPAGCGTPTGPGWG